MAPMRKDPPAMISIVLIRTNLRPRRSAMRPKTNPPRGRAKNPTAKTASVDNNADTGFAGLNIMAAINGAKTAYVLHSYHSRMLPTVLARMERRASRPALLCDVEGGLAM